MLAVNDMVNELRYSLDSVTFARERLGFEPDPWQQKAMRSPAKRILLNCSRQSGKSTSTAIIALHTAIYRPRSLCLMVSPSERQSKELFKKVKGFFAELDHQPKLDEDSKLGFALANGSRVLSLPSSPDTIRGFSAVDLLIEDEAAFCQDSLYRSIRPMLAVSNGKMILMSTPRGKVGHFYEEWVNGGSEWAKIKVTAHECPRITPEFLEQEMNSLGSLWFNQEYMGVFAEREDSVFDHDTVMSAINPEIKPLF
ncbi:MAG: hypothetical protein HQL54_13350 [Magnetococcales bacterium]|nr:hypothetical protein [Magnetococcales bacterium]